MSVWAALGFMLMGGAIVELFDLRAFQMYMRGRRENERKVTK